ncbi:hypothetical protein DAEQUDRAFT_595474 [Daedalea quercina L-15889]|uniref:Xrn1 N-terminal domain-containing protein n=1 Tax=Daedalea quercina L-15889 TaxID=1314783 RepID=A0A165SYK9_9APHY|nr:hypothetical protein DAEQUDRAFT_595474 [Daedalea quercina L-15889]
MGVPALFRWLSKKYPKIILPVVEEDEVKVPDDDGNEVAVPIDISHPNPNEVEFDNLYLDMNGIVHPCTHPEGKPAPETEEEMMLEIFQYTERVVNMIRPRKLLFMAIDGVAPRAKMNQQRSRRFRSAQEAKEKEEARKEAVAMWEAMGKTLSEEEKNKQSWDSNAITPGTPFMDLLATSLRYWVVRKMNTDPGWKQMQVIISDASVPGEGEHKIMDFIRRQRANPGHDPNTRHGITRRRFRSIWECDCLPYLWPRRSLCGSMYGYEGRGAEETCRKEAVHLPRCRYSTRVSGSRAPCVERTLSLQLRTGD